MTWTITCSACDRRAETATAREAVQRSVTHGLHPQPFIVTAVGRTE